MVHMPGHIYYRVGDYAQRRHWFTASIAADERYMREQHVSVDDDWNYVHNLMYSVANLMEQGKFDEATRLSAKITGGARKTGYYPLHQRRARFDVPPRSATTRRPTHRRFPADPEAGNASTLRAGLPNLEFLRRRLLDFASGMQAVDSRQSRGGRAVVGALGRRTLAHVAAAQRLEEMPGMATG